VPNHKKSLPVSAFFSRSGGFRCNQRENNEDLIFVDKESDKRTKPGGKGQSIYPGCTNTTSRCIINGSLGKNLKISTKQIKITFITYCHK
jgi:hypothetical protein